MCFGLSEDLDRESFACFLRLAGDPHLAETLAKRLSTAEILAHVDAFTHLLRQYLSEDEYHRLFLKDDSHPHSGDGEQ